jgi:hypothetical protein
VIAFRKPDNNRFARSLNQCKPEDSFTVDGGILGARPRSTLIGQKPSSWVFWNPRRRADVPRNRMGKTASS